MTHTLKKTFALLHGAVLALRERRIAEARDRLVEAENTLTQAAPEGSVTTAQLTEGAPQ